MASWFRRKPKFKYVQKHIINTLTFTFELIHFEGSFYWGATDDNNLMHQYVSKLYDDEEVAKSELAEFIAYVEENTYGNY